MPRETLTIEEIPLGNPRLKYFVNFPWQLFRGHPYWTPPLNGELLGNRFLGLIGLLNPEHPYHRSSEVTHFLAWRNGKPVGRISAAINHRFNEYHGSKMGFFGFFDVIENYEVMVALLDKARDWVSNRGMKILRGPGEYSNATHERQGILIEGFQYPPTVELTHNFPYYADFLEKYGFHKAKDYYAYIMDVNSLPPAGLKKIAKKVLSKGNIITRVSNPKKLRSEVRLIVKIYNDTWSQNWGFLPITYEEANSLVDTLRIILDPGLVRFACVKGEPVAVIGAFPDANFALRPRWKWYGDSDLVRLIRLFLFRKHIPRVRLMFFGVRPGFRHRGIDAVLFNEIKEYAMRKHYKECDISLLLENNDLILSVSKFMKAKHYKTWRIYDLSLE